MAARKHAPCTIHCCLPHFVGCRLLPGEVHTYLTRVMYQRRNKMNPLWNSLVVAGFKDGESYLGTVDSIATSYTDDHIATGYGEYLARPLMRSRFNPNMSEGDARALLEDTHKSHMWRAKLYTGYRRGAALSSSRLP